MAPTIGAGTGWLLCFDILKGQFGFGHHESRTLEGLHTHVASNLLALAAGIWHNGITNTHHKRSLTAYDH